MFAAPLSRTAVFGLGLPLVLAACVDIVGVENLSAAPPGLLDGGSGGEAGKDGGDSGFSGASGITIDGPTDAIAESLADGSEGGSEDGSSGDASDAGDASPCPVARPIQGTACVGSLECVYDACSEATMDLALASCQSGKWAIFGQPCALYPCGGLQCLFPRLLCVTVQGGASSCADNPCITSLSFGATCACAEQLCEVAPSYQCNPAATTNYLVTCTP